MNYDWGEQDTNWEQYERPNQKWVCGKACNGKPCRLGPDRRGRCRADVGASGPVEKCVPQRSLRAKRKRLTISVSIATTGILLVAICGPSRNHFLSPGPLSAAHATAAFVSRANAPRGEEGCIACHAVAGVGRRGLLAAAFRASPTLLDARFLTSTEPAPMSELDQRCRQCHAGHLFHQPNVVYDHACSGCHREHQGPGPMPSPRQADCLSCHADALVMRKSAELAKTLPAGSFDFRPEQGRVLFKMAPIPGHAVPIHSFASDHPEFQVLAEKLTDQNTLRFNHQLHLSLQPASGHKLACADCHQPDASGVFFLSASYERNCRGCHPLQFDTSNPGLVLPHGSVREIHDFLHSLEEKYRLAGMQAGMVDRREREQFAAVQVRKLLARSGGDVSEVRL